MLEKIVNLRKLHMASLALMGALLLSVAACDDSGVEDAAEDAADKVEDAGEAVGDAAEDAGDKVEDATN